MVSHEENLKLYRALLDIEERTLAALNFSHGSKSPQYHRQYNKVEMTRLQVRELERLIEEKKK